MKVLHIEAGRHLYGGAKQVLYAYRVLLTGIHLLETGDVEANLRVLNQQYRVPGIDELIASKTEEKIAPEMDWEQHADQLQQLESQLDESFAHSPLPEDRDTTAVHQLLVDLRLESRQC